MKFIVYSLLVLLTNTIPSIAQIVKIDTIKSTYVYKKQASGTIGQTEYIYSLGLKLLSIEQLPKILNQTNSTNYISSSLYGLMFKFNDNQISYRLSANYLSKDDFSFMNECDDCESIKGELSDLSLKLGFEKNINYSTIQPYFGFDLGFRKNKFKGKASNAGSLNYTTNYDVTAEKIGGLLSPVLGIKFNLIPHFTLGVESGVDAFISYERQEKTYLDAQRTRTFKNKNNFELLIRPLSLLSIQYNFEHAD